METFGELITEPVVYSTRDGYNSNTGHLAFEGLISVLDVPTIIVGCTMLYICEYWGATALKYTVAMCLMKYYLDTLEHGV